METKRLAGMACLLLATATSAQAQRGLTLFGLIDNSVQFVDNGGHTVVRMNPGQYLGSRWGMRGTEELGSGYTVSFMLEQGVLTNTGAGTVSGLAFSRQAWIGLTTPNLGGMRFGRQNSPVYIPVSGALDAFNGASIASGMDSFLTIVPRVSNAISYQSPEFGGLRSQLMISLRDGNDATNDGIGSYHATLEYASGPVRAVAGYQKVENPIGITYPGASAGTTLKALFVGGSYDFGVASVYLGYNGNWQTHTPLNRDVFLASVKYPLGNAAYVALGFAYAHDKSGQGNNAQQAGAMYDYAFSKRTNLYAAAAWIGNKRQATFAMNGATTAGVPVAYPGATVRGLQVGIVHRF